METFPLSSTMREVYTDPVLSSVSRYLIFRPSSAQPDEVFLNTRFSDFAKRGWSSRGMANGAGFLKRQIQRNLMRQLFIYSPADCMDDPMKKDVNLIQLMPESVECPKPFILLAAGGTYKSVCTLVESLPTAVHMVKRGYTVFLLTYRVSTDRAALKGLDDLAAAISYILKNRSKLGLLSDQYAIGGFSAGANLVCNFGAAHTGYRCYSLPKPRAVFPVYTFIDLKAEAAQHGEGRLLVPMFGTTPGQYIERFNLVKHIDGDFPPCYAVCGKNDTGVSPENSSVLISLLREVAVPAVLEQGDNAPHGFGDGTDTDVAGWPERALDFLEGLHDFALQTFAD